MRGSRGHHDLLRQACGNSSGAGGSTISGCQLDLCLGAQNQPAPARSTPAAPTVVPSDARSLAEIAGDAASLMMISPATQPSRPAPAQTRIGKRSSIAIRRALPATISGTLVASPKVISENLRNRPGRRLLGAPTADPPPGIVERCMITIGDRDELSPLATGCRRPSPCPRRDPLPASAISPRSTTAAVRRRSLR